MYEAPITPVCPFRFNHGTHHPSKEQSMSTPEDMAQLASVLSIDVAGFQGLSHSAFCKLMPSAKMDTRQVKSVYSEKKLN